MSVANGLLTLKTQKKEKNFIDRIIFDRMIKTWPASLVPLGGDCHFFSLKSVDDYYEEREDFSHEGTKSTKKSLTTNNYIPAWLVPQGWNKNQDIAVF